MGSCGSKPAIKDDEVKAKSAAGEKGAATARDPNEPARSTAAPATAAASNSDAEPSVPLEEEAPQSAEAPKTTTSSEASVVLQETSVPQGSLAEAGPKEDAAAFRQAAAVPQASAAMQEALAMEPKEAPEAEIDQSLASNPSHDAEVEPKAASAIQQRSSETAGEEVLTAMNPVHASSQGGELQESQKSASESSQAALLTQTWALHDNEVALPVEGHSTPNATPSELFLDGRNASVGAFQLAPAPQFTSYSDPADAMGMQGFALGPPQIGEGLWQGEEGLLSLPTMVSQMTEESELQFLPEMARGEGGLRPRSPQILSLEQLHALEEKLLVAEEQLRNMKAEMDKSEADTTLKVQELRHQMEMETQAKEIELLRQRLEIDAKATEAYIEGEKMADSTKRWMRGMDRVDAVGLGALKMDKDRQECNARVELARQETLRHCTTENAGLAKFSWLILLANILVVAFTLVWLMPFWSDGPLFTGSYGLPPTSPVGAVAEPAAMAPGSNGSTTTPPPVTPAFNSSDQCLNQTGTCDV
eukprot:CAMPEP_0117686924 /NCGR_PEP_ID=MMETSP0804-20121206/22782_1 /TAXON_ID=1074897 /ORGANISM="Tetraselmis astigmatica, Strain CCMP880" /LENGTH=531 /DNA_ID=CAMNT_0005498795 /DNA_START=453 /DNA_END=2048 /DNA_ORIENTATION=-